MNYCCANGLCFTEDVAEMGQYQRGVVTAGILKILQGVVSFHQDLSSSFFMRCSSSPAQPLYPGLPVFLLHRGLGWCQESELR